MVPILKKRATPDQSDEDETEVPKSKRICTGLLPTPQEDAYPIVPVSGAPLFDDNMRLLLQRSIAMTLQYVGFDTATEEALEGMVSEASEYATTLLRQVTNSMTSSRRAQPIPFDFEYALKEMTLPLSSLEPHLKPPVNFPILRLHEEPLPTDNISPKSLKKLLGKDLSGEADMKVKSYIPKGFPAFPSKHTYKWTEKAPDHIMDSRKVREEAAKNARQAEEALRRLVKVSKAGKDKEVKRIASQDARRKERHELWEKTMESLEGIQSGNDEERCMIVNSEVQFFRQGANAHKKALPILKGPTDIPVVLDGKLG